MTPGDNGASTPEEDDPFGYLYADGQARGAQPPSGGYGYPNSVSRVRTVGERQYGQQQPPYVPPQGAYGQPNAHYQAPETLPGATPPGSRPPAPRSGPGRRGPNTKGLLIGAIAVVAAVVVGISIAMFNGNPDDKNSDDQAGATPAQSQSADPTPTSSASSGQLPKVDAADSSVQLSGGAAPATEVQGAQGAGGKYVGGLNQVGASATWSVDVPSDGAYTLFTRYSATGEDQSMTVTVNGKEFGSKLGLKNWRHAADGDFAQGWTRSYVWPTLKKGNNIISISCQPGDKCNVLLDQLWIKKGQVTG
ncbi:carbohydrate-binding protein [Streptomyces sp. NEAU-sy36]|uniref:carbohydrate-binding protein n=1 Tax=unclassified Streptomyces TaxID=2593676 RepID=UPI0015D5F32B|nr:MULTISPECIES: carbohydrate-binding protein [unclassified Streptomyces]QLI99780.1 carbohydrate-binding protein [Streptomyces sp. NEAU-sy36]